MTEIIPGIYMIRLILPDSGVGSINVFLVKGADGYLMVDTGWNMDKVFDSFKAQLTELKIDIKDIKQLVVTHIHPDHMGLAGTLQQLVGAKLAVHYLESALIYSRYKNMDNLLANVRRLLHTHGVPEERVSELQMASTAAAKYVASARPDIALYDGNTISTGLFNIEVIWTPGHSPGHICLYEPEKKILFSGDHILPVITPNVGLHPESSFNPLGDYINALKRVKQLGVSLALPAHGDPFTTVNERIDEIIHHHQVRDRGILRVMRSEQKTAFQIASQISWISDTNGVGWEALSPLDKRLAVLETIAHLEAMSANDIIVREKKNGTIYYRTSGKPYPA
ncbi:MAG: MBL fold metallo-hydrolase [Chloroflexi bacterium]|nr:MBL fold metallo-hydrolase [Chloroflexota bacterium]